MAGVAIPFWLALALLILGSLYPDYSQFEQSMSVLGAVDAPTHFIAPIINNFPLGLLFILFGVSVYKTFPQSALARFSGLLIVLHGLASFVTGDFACDAGCSLDAPSTTQQIHHLAGLVMAWSLIGAGAIWAWLGLRLQGFRGLAFLSMALTLVALVTVPMVAISAKNLVGHGLYERVNAFVSAIWVAIFAVVLLRRNA
ncbi:DUF998 domain-containing protein [Pseudomonas sp.]